jgi:hypothetical protein
LDLRQSARTLLDGFIARDNRGRQSQRYLKPGSLEEARARRALARLILTNGLDGLLRISLAELFDPSLSIWQQRKISFVNRFPGKLRDHVARTEVVRHIAAQIRSGSGVNAAIDSAARKFSMSTEMVKRIWRSYCRAYDRFGRKNWLSWV